MLYDTRHTQRHGLLQRCYIHRQVIHDLASKKSKKKHLQPGWGFLTYSMHVVQFTICSSPMGSQWIDVPPNSVAPILSSSPKPSCPKWISNSARPTLKFLQFIRKLGFWKSLCFCPCCPWEKRGQTLVIPWIIFLRKAKGFLYVDRNAKSDHHVFAAKPYIIAYQIQ